MESLPAAADNQSVNCPGCRRAFPLPPTSSKRRTGSGKSPFLCEACKKFYSRNLNMMTAEDACVCGKEDGENCRSCRFKRCRMTLLKRPYCESAPRNRPETNSDRVVDSEKRIDFSKLPCAVCGFSSSGFHFGVVSCEGCKGFFRRSMNKNYKLKYKCKNPEKAFLSSQYLCPSASNCRKCRLHRCIKAGMSFDEVTIGRLTLQRRAEIDSAIRRHCETGGVLPSKIPRRHAVLVNHSSGSAATSQSSYSGVLQSSGAPVVDNSCSSANSNSNNISSNEQPSDVTYPDIAFPASWYTERAVEAAQALIPISKMSIHLNRSTSVLHVKQSVIASMEELIRLVAKYSKILPGTSQLSIEDRVLLFSQSLHPIVTAQLVFDIDPETSMPSIFGFHRDPDTRAMLDLALPTGCDCCDSYLAEARNQMGGLKDLQEFTLLCALLMFNPGCPNLSDVSLVAKIRLNYELALTKLLNDRDAARAEQQIAHFYSLIAVLRRATWLFDDLFAVINERKPVGEHLWTPLVTQIITHVGETRKTRSQHSQFYRQLSAF